MAITVKPPLDPIADVSIEIEYRQFELLKHIREKCSVLDAIMMLRYMFPQCGLKQAKIFIEEM